MEACGIDAAVVNCRFLKPLDEELLCRWAKKIKRVLTVEENVLQGGFGSAVIELLRESALSSVEVRCLGIPDLFIENGSQSQLRERYGIDRDGIFREVQKWVGQRPRNLLAVQRQ